MRQIWTHLYVSAESGRTRNAVGQLRRTFPRYVLRPQTELRLDEHLAGIDTSCEQHTEVP